MSLLSKKTVWVGGNRWQGEGEYEWSARVVLHCVLARASARELWSCGAVCRAWRYAAADARLWRRLLQPHAHPETLAALTHLSKRCQDDHGSVDKSESWWRYQYTLSVAHWRRRGRLATAVDGVALSCAALHEQAPLLALLRDDAHLTVWSRSSCSDAGAEQWSWRACWAGVVSAEWRGVADARWAPHAPRLLVAGPLALAERLEVIVMDFDEPCHGVVACRAVSSPGAAGCWVDDTTFLTLELRLLAPAQACTTLWLNASTQEIQSEYAGVMAPLLRIYNESAATISHVTVAELPLPQADSAVTASVRGGRCVGEPSASYYHALAAVRDSLISFPPTKSFIDWKSIHESLQNQGTNSRSGAHVFIAAGGAARGPKGEARALLLWCIASTLAPPPLYVTDDLAERVRRHRDQARRSPELEVELDEAAVRALCTPPTSVCQLSAQILGFVLHPGRSCLWANTAAGAACVALPALRTLLWLPLTPAPRTGTVTPPHCVLPSADDDFFITPVGGGSVRAVTWLVRGGARGTVLSADALVLAALLLPRPGCSAPCVLLLTVEALEVWQIHLP